MTKTHEILWGEKILSVKKNYFRQDMFKKEVVDSKKIHSGDGTSKGLARHTCKRAMTRTFVIVLLVSGKRWKTTQVKIHPKRA